MDNINIKYIKSGDYSLGLKNKLITFVENKVILLVKRFILARIEYCPEDFSAQLILQATQSAQGEDFNKNLFCILKSKPFEWKLCFDPSPGLKAFSWAYSKQHHIILCALMGLCYFKKCYANHLDEYQFTDLASTYQTQDSFLNYLHRAHLHENSFSVEENEVQELLGQFVKYLETHINHSKLNDDSLEIIKNYLGLV